MSTDARSSTGTVPIKTDASEYLEYDNHCEGVLKRLRGRPELCDVVLIVGDSGKRISAHRLILIAFSDYFSALLSSPMHISQEREIVLNEVDGDALEKLVNFCYTGRLELRDDTIEALLTTANYLQLKEITESCCEFLLHHLRLSNCLSVNFFAEQFNIESLMNNTKKFICENFEEISNHPEFFLLNAKQLSEFIASDELDVPSEEFVFLVLMKWIEYEPENRWKHFTELLAQVRLPLLPPSFLTEKVEPLCKTTESQELVVNALQSHLQLTSNSIQPRKYQSAIVVKHLLAIYARNTNLEIAGYSLRSKRWTTWNTQIQLSSTVNFYVARLDENLIVVDGVSNDSRVNKVINLNLNTMASTEMSPLKTGRRGHSVAVLNDSIYVIGGQNGWPIIASVERWDPADRKWCFVAPMANARETFGMAVINNKIYVSGGYNNGLILASVECYDPVENSWEIMTPLKVARYSHCLAAHNGFLFAIGGYSDIGRSADTPIERYDPRTDTWTTISCSQAIHGCTKCTSLGSDLFIYNNSNFYTVKISSKGSCNNLKLKLLPNPNLELSSDAVLHLNCTELVKNKKL